MNNEQIIEQIKEYMQANNLKYLRKSNLADFAIQYHYEIEDINNLVYYSENDFTSFAERIGNTIYTRYAVGGNLRTNQIEALTGLVKCYGCGIFHTPNEFITSDGKHFCSTDCAKQYNYFICSACNKFEKSAYNDGTTHICNNCISEYATSHNLQKCSSCGNYFATSQLYKIGNNYYCTSCADNSYNRNYNSYHSGRRGWEPRKNNREKSLFLGYENEFEIKGNTPRGFIVYGVNEILKQQGLEGFFLYETDGSLYNGLEFPTQPFTPAWLIANEEKLQPAYDFMLQYKCTGEKNDTAGLHVHISRSAFSKPYTLAKVAYLIHKLQYDFIKYSNRSVASLSYCQFDKPNNDGEYTLTDFKRKYSDNKAIAGNHGVAVNREHTNTIEIRIFKGTLDLKRIIANCELVYNLVEYCEKHTEEQVKNVTFKELCLWKKTKYLKPLYYKLFEPTTKIKSKGVA